MDSLLEGVRVLDLTDEKGLLAGRMLADLGADVIKIEKPGGDDARNIGPFYQDVPDPEKSLLWFAFNLNKRGITLDVRCQDGKTIFKQLSNEADVVIESFGVGHMERIGLSYSILSEINPGLVMASITPFGQAGPYKDYKASDIVGMGMGGYLYLCGEPDTPPIRISAPQAYLNAASEAAAAVMIALYHREATGEGQFVDVSMQQSLVMTTVQAIPFWLLNKVVLERSGPFRTGLTSGTLQRQTWPCKDGLVNFVIYGGRAGAEGHARLVEWMDEEGMATDYLKQLDFAEWDVFNISQGEWDSIESPIGKFFLTHTKAELVEGGMKRLLPICPVSSPSEVVNSAQLGARGFWIEVEHPELRTTLKYPGFCPRFSETPCRVWRRAPLIGEHNMEVYSDELGLAAENIMLLKEAGVI
jgi:crotonobetainyl-CoA:carnitine CoA-transferase CaiB-like acyl-CoA transferase